MEQVEANLNYLKDDGRRPQFFLYTPPAGVDARPPENDRRRVAIHDARAIGDSLSLDVEGLALLRQRSGFDDFADPGAVRARYYPEVEALVQAHTGAEKVVAFDHNLRHAPWAERGEHGAQTPVKFVHNDYTDRSGPQRVRDLLPPDEAEARLARRAAVVNVWRPLRGPVQDVPLAVCDAASMKPDHFVASDLCYPDRTGEIYGVRFDPAHRWLYVSEMQAEELMLLKCFDSARDGRARYTAHSAFRHPQAPEDALPRRSIEVRTFAFF